jgi:hypothetical protein
MATTGTTHEETSGYSYPNDRWTARRGAFSDASRTCYCARSGCSVLDRTLCSSRAASVSVTIRKGGPTGEGAALEPSKMVGVIRAHNPVRTTFIGTLDPLQNRHLLGRTHMHHGLVRETMRGVAGLGRAGEATASGLDPATTSSTCAPWSPLRR